MIRRIWIVFCFVAFAFKGIARLSPDDSVRILFVGNSLTYVNDLPSMVSAIGKLDGKKISYTSFLFPDYSLEDHWNEGRVKTEIEKGIYDFVVAQQGPSALSESQILLADYARRFAELCNKNKSHLALYMVWPSKARSFDMDNVIASYTRAADSALALLCPAGLGWKYGWQEDPGLALYSADNFHPSLMGSLLAALVIYGSIFNKDNFSFIQYNSSPWKDIVSEQNAAVLLRAAGKAIRK